MVLAPQVPKESSVVIFDYVRLDRDCLIGQVVTTSVETMRLVNQWSPLTLLGEIPYSIHWLKNMNRKDR